MMVCGAGIAKSGEDVPGSCDGEEEQQSGEEMELAPATPLSGEGQIGNESHANDDEGEESLGEYGESQQHVACIPVAALVGAVKGRDQTVKCGGNEEAEDRLWNEHAGEEEISETGDREEPGVESRARTEGASAPGGARGAPAATWRAPWASAQQTPSSRRRGNCRPPAST